MSLRDHLRSEIDVKHTENILILCFFISGLVDSVATSLFGCFVMMQTGNTIYLAIGVSTHPRYSPSFAWIKALAAIGCFWIGSLFFSTFHQKLGALKRYVVMGSFAIQSALMVTAAVLIHAKVTSHSKMTPESQRGHSQWSIGHHDVDFPWLNHDLDLPWLDLLPIGFLSMQSAGQVYASRALQHSMLPTVVLTAMYCDVISSFHGLREGGFFSDTQRNARVAGALCLFVGALVGGVFGTSTRMGYVGALWLAAGLKSSIIIAWFLWKPVKLQGRASLV